MLTLSLFGIVIALAGAVMGAAALFRREQPPPQIIIYGERHAVAECKALVWSGENIGELAGMCAFAFLPWGSTDELRGLLNVIKLDAGRVYKLLILDDGEMVPDIKQPGRG